MKTRGDNLALSRTRLRPDLPRDEARYLGEVIERHTQPNLRRSPPSVRDLAEGTAMADDDGQQVEGPLTHERLDLAQLSGGGQRRRSRLPGPTTDVNTGLIPLRLQAEGGGLAPRPLEPRGRMGLGFGQHAAHRHRGHG